MKKHEEILAKIDDDFEQARQNQTACYNDRRFAFVSGAQWDGKIGWQFANRPKFEFNKIQLSIIRIYNEWAKNRFSVQFRPDALPADQDTAVALNKLIRGDERDSNSDEAYSNAFIEGISGGIGAFMLIAEYENPYDDSERQRIRIKPIFEADTCVYWDANAKRQDKTDARHVTLLVSMGRDEYESKYGDNLDNLDGFDGFSDNRIDWMDDDNVKVAEYYEVQEKRRVIIKLVHPHDDDIILYEDDDNFQKELDEMLARGFVLKLKKSIKERQIHGYVLSGSKILKKIGRIAGDYLPIIPYYGKRTYISGREITQGHVRLARDAQVAYNIKMSALLDLSSRPQDELPIFTNEQINGHSKIWADKEIEKPAYLTINPLMNPVTGEVTAVGPQSYTKPPQVPPALAAIIDKADQDIHELTGNQQNGEQLVSNVATQAVEMVQEKVDAQSYIYIDNWAKTMQHMGVVWLSMAKVVYDEESRQMMGVSHDDEFTEITINKPTIKNGRLSYENDIQNGLYRAIVDVGEAFSVARDKTVKSLVGMLPIIQDPVTQMALVNTILSNQDGEGMADLAKFARKQLVMSQIVTPTDDEQVELEQVMLAQSQKPNPQEEWLKAEASKATSQAEKAKADTMQALAHVDKTRADTAKALFELQQSQINQGAIMGEMMAILQAMQDAQAQHGRTIKAEVSNKEMPQMPMLPPVMSDGVPDELLEPSQKDIGVM